MTIAIYDRVKESTTTSGTGIVTLAGAATGYRSFSSTIGTGNLTYYGIVDNTTGDWEVGIGTLLTATTLSRTTALSSSNANALVSFAANAKDVMLDVPASRRLQTDSLSGSNGITVSGNVISPTYGANLNQIAQGNDARFFTAGDVKLTAALGIPSGWFDCYGANLNQIAQGNDARFFTAGDVKLTAALGIPSGWFDCYGATMSRTTYSALYTAITLPLACTTTNASSTMTTSDTSQVRVGCPVEGTGIAAGTTIAALVNGTTFTLSANATASGTGTIRFFPFGSGDGSTSFNLPDLQGRVPIGMGSGSGLSNRVIGQSGGEETHLLTVAEMPSHSHIVTFSLGNGSQGYDGTALTGNSVAASNGSYANIAAANTGSGGSHNTMPPFNVLKYIIKY